MGIFNKHLGRGISRAVIKNQVLEIRISLPRNGLNALLKVFTLVPRGGDDGKERLPAYHTTDVMLFTHSIQLYLT
jgi:hypothetical protein